MPRRKLEPDAARRQAPRSQEEALCLPVICANIRSRRLSLGLEQKELAARLGVHKNAVSGWETGRSRPDLSLIPALCRVLGLSPAALLGMAEPAPRYSAREEDVIRHYRQLEPPLQAHAEAMLLSLVQAQEARNSPALHEICFQPIRLAAGADAGFRDLTETETLYLYDSPLLARADSVYKVNGDSMEPDFHDGDLVFVEHIPDGASMSYGEIGAFLIGNESYIKEYQPDGLHSHNPRYGVMRFDGDAASVYLIGRVLGVVDPALLPREEEIRRYLRAKSRKEGE